jgi:hypothetical protein
MAKISNTAEYPFRSPQLTDYVIGTASTGSPDKKTSNFLISDILALVNPGPGPGPGTGITNLTVPVWKNDDSQYVDSSITQLEFGATNPLINVACRIEQSGIAQSTLVGTNAGAFMSLDDGPTQITAFGKSALANWTTGDGGDGAIVPGKNVAIGHEALLLSERNLYNTAVGAGSGTLYTVGDKNTTVGYLSLNNASEIQVANVVVGAEAAYQDTQGAVQLTSNAIVGFAALKDIQVNDPVADNVVIGTEALSFAGAGEPIEFLSNNVMIGHDAAKNLSGVSGADIQDNVIIGNSAGNAMLNAGKQTQNIGIGKNALSEFHVEAGLAAIGNNNLEIAVDSNNILGDADGDYWSIGNIVIGGQNVVRDSYNLMIGYVSTSPGDANIIGQQALPNEAKENVIIGGKQVELTGQGAGTGANSVLNSLAVEIDSSDAESTNNCVLNATSVGVQNSKNNLISGDSHNVNGGETNVVFGSSHEISTIGDRNSNSLLVGSNHDKKDSKNNFITGSNNVINVQELGQQDNSSMLGSNLQLGSPSCTVVGTYNNPTPTGQGNSLFMVGMGDDRGVANALNVNTVGYIMMDQTALFNYADDTAAGAGGVPINGLYHTNGTLKIRLT